MVSMFVCPQCGAPSLKVVKSMDLPSDGRSDDVILQVTQCSSCSFRGLALYEESRRGGMGDETWEHSGFWASDEAVSEVEDLFSQCSSPRDKRCSCDSHKKIVAATSRGQKWRLALLDEYGCELTFIMKHS